MTRLSAIREAIRTAVVRSGGALVLLFAAVAYVIAEDITLTTYYPSPRGVYQTLRSTGQTTLAETGGNVGIGTTTPGANAKFEVFGAGAPDYAMFTDNATATLRVGNDGASNLRLRTDGAQDLIFAPGATEKVRITDTGNVGIGTPGPAERLHVTARSLFGTLMIGETGGGFSMVEDRGATGLALTSNGSLTNGIIVTEGGNVGIGTSAPANRLQIVGAGGAAYDLRVNGRIWTGDGGTLGGVLLNSAGTMFIGQNGNTIGFWTVPAAWNSLSVHLNGNVGIGVLSPAVPDQRLHVAGNIHATGWILADSDARLKQDVQPLAPVLASLEALTPVSYTPSPLGVARGQPPDTRQLGLIGQELEQVFPELVVVSGEEAYRAVDYSRLTVVLLEAVKELKAAHEEALAQLRAENGALRQRLEKIEERESKGNVRANGDAGL